MVLYSVMGFSSSATDFKENLGEKSLLKRIKQARLYAKKAREALDAINVSRTFRPLLERCLILSCRTCWAGVVRLEPLILDLSTDQFVREAHVVCTTSRDGWGLPFHIRLSSGCDICNTPLIIFSSQSSLLILQLTRRYDPL